MLKKITLIIVFQFLIGLQLVAQHASVELSYLSLRPFIHFQLDFDTHGYDAYNSYESSYVNGYMDGVNKSRHYLYDSYHPYWYEEAYEAGYRDGFRDHKLYVSLRGYSSYKRHRFNRRDYHSPYYSVRVWLDGLSVAFLKAPAYKLPHRWEYHAHPKVKKYRRQLAVNHRKGYSGSYKYHHADRVYKKRTYQSRKESRRYKKNLYRGNSHEKRSNNGYTYRKKHLNKSGNKGRVGQKHANQNSRYSAEDNREYRKRSNSRKSIRDRSDSRKTERRKTQTRKKRQ